jgi:NADPH:quinone reductase-like Zn-dependent oxidoreductase
LLVSGTGAYACQLAKNVFHAGKVITTVSTAKVAKVPGLLGKDVVDQIIDYTKDDPMKVIAPGSVDFILDTTGEAMRFLSIMTPSTSFLASIATMPSGDLLQNSSVMRRPDNPQLPWLARIGLNFADAIRRARARRWGVEYEYFFLEPNAEDLETLSKHVKEGKLVPVVGSRVRMQDIEKVREACGLVYKGKGGIGKTIIEVTQT